MEVFETWLYTSQFLRFCYYKQVLKCYLCLKKKKYPWKWANCILLLSDTSDRHFLRTHLVDLFSGNCLLNHYCHNMAYAFCWPGQRQKVTCKYFSECRIIILLLVTSTICIFFLFFQILTATWVSITFSPVRHGHSKRVLKRIIFIALGDLTSSAKLSTLKPLLLNLSDRPHFWLSTEKKEQKYLGE